MTLCVECPTVLSRFNHGERCWQHTDWTPIIEEMVTTSTHRQIQDTLGFGKVGPSSARFVSGGFPEDMDRRDLEALRDGSWLHGVKL